VAEADAITEDEFGRLSDFLYRRTGMVFTETKRYYVQRRVSDRMMATGATSFASYFARLRGDIGGEVEQFINAFTVNETYFYREDHQLSCLTNDILVERARARPRSEAIRIWSAPCSTGEEPYSIAIWLLENWAQVGANLVETAETRPHGQFDVIFCRNVLIYFDDASRRIAAENLYENLAPGGFICLGHTESMSRISPLFEVRRFADAIVYQRPMGGARG
jgi:chemotaxis methyl-accepting protein methylase